MTTSLPSWSSASFVASIEPSASPSGASCVVTRNRSCERITSAAAAGSVVDGRDFIDETGHPHPVLDRGIVLERQAGSPLEAQLAVDARLQDPVRALERDQRLLPPPLGAEH